MVMHLFIWCVFTCITYIQCMCDNSHLSCKTLDGKYGTCINGTCSVIEAEVRNNLHFCIVVKYPEVNLWASRGKDLYIRGSGLGYSWQKGIKLNKTNVDTWRITVLYKSTSSGFICQNCPDQSYITSGHFEFRIYINDSTNMIGGNLKIKLPVSKSSNYFEHPTVHFVYPWFFSKMGSSNVAFIESPEIGGNRSILIYTPPSFYENSYKTYSSILVFDLNEEIYNISAELINNLTVRDETVGEYILVGFGDYHPLAERTELLTQVNGPGFVCMNGTFQNRCGGCLPVNFDNYTQYLSYMNKCGREVQMGGKGNETLDFLIKTVLPKAREITNSRMLIDQPNLGVMGYSLGGLMACHAAWTRPSVFGFAACQSPSFWWPKLDDNNDAFFFNNITLKDSSLYTNRRFQKIYLDAGSLETDMPFTLTQAMVSAAEFMSNTAFFNWDTNLWAEVYPGDPHSISVWISRLWKPLSLFFPTSPAPNETKDNQISTDCGTNHNAVNGTGCRGNMRNDTDLTSPQPNVPVEIIG